jgi:hypothetical protein
MGIPSMFWANPRNSVLKLRSRALIAGLHSIIRNLCKAYKFAFNKKNRQIVQAPCVCAEKFVDFLPKI